MIVAALHLVQAGVYGVAAWELSNRWDADAVAIGVAALAQALGVLRRPRAEPWIHLASLVLVLFVYGRFAASALHVQQVFGPLAADQAMALLGSSIIVLPWLLAFPLVRLWTTRGRSPSPPGPSRAALLAPLALLPALEGLLPSPTFPASERAPEVAAALWARWNGDTAALDTLALPEGAPVRVTPLRAGVPGEPRTVNGGALADALAGLSAPAERDGLVVDLAAEALPAALVRSGTDAPAAADARSPVLFARSVGRGLVLPGFSAPTAKSPTLRWRSALASPLGVTPLERGWAPGPATIDTATIDAALAAAVAHLAHGMSEDGRFTYIVRGPAGVSGGGYNYPRHAGTAWFLARAWAATGDNTAATAADAALAHLDRTSGRTNDGRAYVLDPARDDGKAWIGTTALGALALSVRRSNDPLFRAYVRQIAASVDDAGKVRGEMRIADTTFPDQDANAYGQGQAMLALAAAERAGLTDGAPALDRTIRFLESGDYAGSAHPVATGDEHWTCLAARAIRDVRQVSAGEGICDAYVATERWGAPPAGAGLAPATGPGAGAAEALAARAWDTHDPALIAATTAWARLFLAAQYRPADAPLLGAPEALLGGFRDGPGALDVQIDSVQHIGCALLGAEALLSGRARPGSLP